jgi:phosphoribosylcarboxyaminoimidazole (NCAIR) mutase
VATVAVGKAGAQNAGHLAAQILSLSSPKLRAKIRAGRKAMAGAVEEAAKRLR